LMVPDMCRYAITTVRDSELLIRLIAETPRTGPLRTATSRQDIVSSKRFHRLHRRV